MFRKASKADSEDDLETPAEKKVRLAKEYIQKIEEAKGGREGVQEQLEDEARTAAQVPLALRDVSFGEPRFLRGHKLAPTSVAVTADERTIFTGGKDCALLRWDVETGKKELIHWGRRNNPDCGGHAGQILDICLWERQTLLSVGVDRVLRFWDARCPPRTACVEKLMGHSKAVTGVALDPGTEDLAYTSSYDRSVKVWDLANRRIRETLFGHTSEVTALDIMQPNRPLTGGYDKTVRFWKVERETHALFDRHTYAVDAVSAVTPQTLVSGSQNGLVNLWSTMKKKPLAQASLGERVWISAAACVRRSDLFFTGSSDGYLRPWQIKDRTDSSAKLELAQPPIKVRGTVNGMAVTRRFVICAVGKEHKFGTWWLNKQDFNGLCLVPMTYTEHEVSTKASKRAES